MASFIQPVRPIDPAPPWGWNPGETFVTAFNESRLAQQKAKEMELSNQLESILLPYRQKKAALDLDKMQFDVELQTERLDREREVYREMRKQGFGRSGANSNVAGNGGPGNQQQVTDPRNPLFHFQSRNTTPAPAPTTGQPAPTGKKVKLTF